MTYLVVLDQHDNRLTATVPALPGCAAEGTTREQVLDAVRIAIGERLTRSEIVTVDAPPGSPSNNPWLHDAGILAGHPAWQVFQDGVRSARQEVNEAVR